MQSALSKQPAQLAILVSIFLFAFFLRTTEIGALPLIGDESWNAWLSFDFGQNGQRSELGVTSSAGVNQPPFFYDVFAIPFFMSPDPRIARLFMGLLQLISLPVLYRLVTQIWSGRIALVALLIYTIMPRAVWAGRAIWNPYLFLPFVLIFYLAGFWLITKKTRRKNWARWLLLPALSCVIQSHPITICTTVLVPVFWLRDWQLTSQSQRGKMIRAHALGLFLAALTFIPWGVGYVRQQVSTPYNGHMSLRARSPFDSVLHDVLVAPTGIDAGGFGLLGSDYTAPGDPWRTLFLAFGVFNILGSLILLANARRRFEDGMLGLAFLIMPIFSFLSPTRTYGHYMVITLPAIAMIEAILLVRLAQVRRLAVVAIALFIILMGGQLFDLLDALRQVRNFNDPQKTQSLSLDQSYVFRDQLAKLPNEIVYSMNKDFTHALLWQMLGPKDRSQVVWKNNFSLPIPSGGVTYVDVSLEADQAIPPSYLKKTIFTEYAGFYRLLTLPANTRIDPTCKPAVPATRFTNGAALLGYYIEPGENQTPHAGQPWTVYLVWQNTPSGNVQEHQIFIHLVDETGWRYAQTDFEALSPTLWHTGDLIVSRVTLTSPPDLPHRPLFLHVGLYTLPDVKNFHLLDADGNDIAQWITIPICTVL